MRGGYSTFGKCVQGWLDFAYHCEAIRVNCQNAVIARRIVDSRKAIHESNANRHHAVIARQFKRSKNNEAIHESKTIFGLPRFCVASLAMANKAWIALACCRKDLQ